MACARLGLVSTTLVLMMTVSGAACAVTFGSIAVAPPGILTSSATGWSTFGVFMSCV